MDCKDLMVGDWVSYKDDPPYIVRGTSICKVVTIDNGIDHRNVMDDAINPISLTEEILVKNGFEKTTNDWNRHRPLIIFESIGFPTISIHADMDMKHFWVHGTIDLTYVHTLQHLVRLCGIEKEIEL